MPGAAHRLRVLGVTVAVLAVLGACSTDPPTPSGQPSSAILAIRDCVVESTAAKGRAAAYSPFRR